MSTLTIKLDDFEVDEIEKLKIYLDEKTSTGCLRKMIKNYIDLDKQNNERWISIRSLKNDNRRLKESGQTYFDSMHKLMRDCEFESKL